MNPQRVLLAEDDPHLGALVVRMLRKSGLEAVDWVRNGEDACEYCLSSFYDVAILDWMMPKLSGVEACRRLRKERYSGAILMLTAKDALEDRIEGLDAGADDYLMKPFEIGELLARLRALCRRNFAPVLEEKVRLDGLVLNRSSQEISQESFSAALSPREFQLLDLLQRNRGAVLPRELIMERIWGYESEVSPKIVDATVKLLRKKLKPFGHSDSIHSVRGVGYKLEAGSDDGP
ncbi:response regulator transcription factor [Cohnella fermenti]|uniref:Response regulator transcription factor n=1 Tax=Cohnella fermenti TaxID=2565925 RepID=A0A4S4BUJ2_9BACL|nr:response regulator transcription factor [Cohnella fermenti]THF78776.1 response regulator transcription factor [Cohnella fermenti]